MKYSNKRVLVWKKGQTSHVDEVTYPQSSFMSSFEHDDKTEDDEGESDILIVVKNCRMTLEWD